MKMGIKLTLAVLTAGSVFTLFAAEVLKPAELKDFSKNSNLSAENGTFTGKGSITVVSAKSFKVDPTKKYKLSGKFRAKSGNAPTDFYFGFIPYDVKKQGISSVYVCHLPNTETELVEPAKIGDAVLKVKDASKWNKSSPYRAVAFNAKSDFSDLPNRDFAPITEGKIEKKNEIWEITLKSPLKKEYPKGTKIRQHTYGSAYIYTAHGGGKASADWKTFSGVISGKGKAGNQYKQWWPGTDSARILMLLNHGAKGNSAIEFKEIVLETID